jgi:hypothetical protein
VSWEWRLERNKRGVRAVPLDPKITIERRIIGTQEGCTMSMGIYIGKGFRPFRSRSQTSPYRTLRLSTCRLDELLAEHRLLRSWRLEWEAAEAAWVAEVARVEVEQWEEVEMRSRAGEPLQYPETQGLASEYYQHHVECVPTASGVQS